MEVNQEIAVIEDFLPKAAGLLAIGGVMAIISFHSLEDRLVKRFFTGDAGKFIYPQGLPAPVKSTGPAFERITRKSVTASEEEVERNPRARSARLRAARRVS
jgi:16S rRNA (cytosine1402-N4)-methyltransferase